MSSFNCKNCEYNNHNYCQKFNVLIFKSNRYQKHPKCKKRKNVEKPPPNLPNQLPLFKDFVGNIEIAQDPAFNSQLQRSLGKALIKKNV
jgi:hypothetical protein